MTLSKPTKVALGLLTVWPLAYMCLFFAMIAFFMFTIMAAARSHGPAPEGIDFWFFVVFALHFATALLTMGLMVFYIVHLFQTNLVANDRKVLWAIVLFMGGPIAMPIYFWLYLWREPPPAPLPSPA
jgi:hypothetical protein